MRAVASADEWAFERGAVGGVVAVAVAVAAAAVGMGQRGFG